MGILDSLENSPAFKSALGQLEGAVLPVVLSEVLGNGSQGGLNAIIAKLQQAGFGDQVKSWIGNGQNLPITAEQLQQVLGSDTVKQWPRGSTFRSTNSARFWRKCFPPRWIMPVRTASSPIPPERRGRPVPDASAVSSRTPEMAFIALKSLSFAMR
jgi:hypothetical protein